MSFAAEELTPRRLPRRPPAALAAARAATAPRPTRCCSRPSSRRVPGERVLELGCGAGRRGALPRRAGCRARAARARAAAGLRRARAPQRRRERPAARRCTRATSAARPRRCGGWASTTSSPIRPSTRRRRRPRPTPGRDLAHREARRRSPTGSTPGCAGSLPGGRLVLIHRTARLGEILAALGGRAGAVEVLPIASRAGRPAARVLVRARKGEPRAAYSLLSLNLPSRKFARRRRRDLYCRSAGRAAGHGGAVAGCTLGWY